MKLREILTEEDAKTPGGFIIPSQGTVEKSSDDSSFGRNAAIAGGGAAAGLAAAKIIKSRQQGKAPPLTGPVLPGKGFSYLGKGRGFTYGGVYYKDASALAKGVLNNKSQQAISSKVGQGLTRLSANKWWGRIGKISQIAVIVNEWLNNWHTAEELYEQGGITSEDFQSAKVMITNDAIAQLAVALTVLRVMIKSSAWLVRVLRGGLAAAGPPGWTAILATEAGILALTYLLTQTGVLEWIASEILWATLPMAKGAVKIKDSIDVVYDFILKVMNMFGSKEPEAAKPVAGKPSTAPTGQQGQSLADFAKSL